MKICTVCHKRYPDDLTECPEDGAPLILVPGQDLVGQRIDGRFEMLKSIGEGGMGSVYRARQLSVNREVALKVIRAEMAANENAILRFLQEATIASRLRCPNTITVLDSGQTEDGLLYIAMELLSGRDLADLLRSSGHLRVSRTVRLLVQICNSLMEAHEAGVVHRDLKPANLMIEDRSGHPDFLTVMDFGIARVAQEEGKEPITGTGLIVGTPMYMSPEQIRGKQIDHRSDIYALGVIAYEMLCGHPPFRADSYQVVFSLHCTKPPRSLMEAWPGLHIPQPLDELILRCLAKNPEERPDSVMEVKDALLALEVSDEFGPQETGALPFSDPPIEISNEMKTRSAVDLEQAPPGPLTGGTTRASQWKRRIPQVLLVALLITAGVLLWAPWTKPPPVIELPDSPRVAVLPFHSEPERQLDEQLWPLADRVVLNRLNQALPGSDFRLVDPLEYERKTRFLQVKPPFDADAVRELAPQLEADLLLAGSLERKEGLIHLHLWWYLADGTKVGELDVSHVDLFPACRSAAEGFLAWLPKPEGDADGEENVDSAFRDAWENLVRDPWNDHLYTRLQDVVPDAWKGSQRERFIHALGQARDHRNTCDDSLSTVADDEHFLGLARAVCAHRRMRVKEALAFSEEAYKSLAHRRSTAVFITNIQTHVPGQDTERCAAFLEERTRLFPEDIEAWFLLALYRADLAQDYEEPVQVAQFLSAKEERPFRAALNMVRFYMQVEDFKQAESWMERLERVAPSSDWERLYRARRKAGLLQLRGRFGEAWRVLEATRSELAESHGDPYTIAALVLFYSYLRFEMWDQAQAVADEYIEFFEGTGKPDLHAAMILKIALEAARSKDKAFRNKLVPHRKAIEKAAGSIEADGQACQAIAHVEQPERSLALVRRTSESNTMVGCCRVRGAEVLMEEGKHLQARRWFHQARKDLLFRSDWCMEYYPRALLGEAQAAAAAGDREAALVLYRQLMEQYEAADRDLPELETAAKGIKLLNR